MVYLTFHRFVHKFIKHRHQMTAILLQAPHIGAGVDQLDYIQQILAAPGPELQGVYRSASAMNSNVACVIRPDRVSPWRAA